MTRPIFFLSDFGLADTYVGIVKAVILGIAPDARIVDLTHDVPAQDVRAAAFALLTAAPYLPEDAVVLAVVDPGVGTARRPIAVQVGERSFVGPDNGLLSWAVRAEAGGAVSIGDQNVGAIHRAHVLVAVLDQPRFWRPEVSATFHGRDVFGPVAAHLARGVPLADLGSPTDDIETLAIPDVRREEDERGQERTVHGEVIHVDRYGNLVTNLSPSDLPRHPVIEVRGVRISGLAPHFQDGSGPLLALIGSVGLVEIAIPNGTAAAVLGAHVGTTVTVQPRR